MKRFLITGFLVAFAPFATTAASSAQSMTATPSPAPIASAEPDHRLFRKGPQFVAVGVSAGPNVQSEFRPGSTSGLPSFEGWQTGESRLLGHFHVLSYTDYRSFAYRHLASDPVATVGGGGFAAVPAFQVHDDELESGGGIQIAPHIFVGGSLLARRENSGYPALHGIGYVLMLAPNLAPVISPYGWISYTPNAGGLYTLNTGFQTALTYRGTRYRVGAIVNEPGTRLYLDIGLAGEDLQNRTNAPATIRDTMLTTGLGIRF